MREVGGKEEDRGGEPGNRDHEGESQTLNRLTDLTRRPWVSSPGPEPQFPSDGSEEEGSGLSDTVQGDLGKALGNQEKH